MKRIGWLVALALAVLVALLVHQLWFAVMRVPADGLLPTFQPGDRVVVNRWSYGYRTPFSEKWGYHRWRAKAPLRGDWAAYNCPSSELTTRPDTLQLFLGNILALPADTVWMGRGASVGASRSYERGLIWPVVVPTRGAYIKVHPWDAPLYAKTLRQHEGIRASVRHDSLCIDDSTVSSVRFRQDYYWMSSLNDTNFTDSRVLGFVPRTHLMGRVTRVLYSIDGWRVQWRRTLYKGFSDEEI